MSSKAFLILTVLFASLTLSSLYVASDPGIPNGTYNWSTNWKYTKTYSKSERVIAKKDVKKRVVFSSQKMAVRSLLSCPTVLSLQV
jgi:hypothetical protein